MKMAFINQIKNYAAQVLIYVCMNLCFYLLNE